jgi:hypothetical protein
VPPDSYFVDLARKLIAILIDSVSDCLLALVTPTMLVL